MQMMQDDPNHLWRCSMVSLSQAFFRGAVWQCSCGEMRDDTGVGKSMFAFSSGFSNAASTQTVTFSVSYILQNAVLHLASCLRLRDSD